MIACRVCGDEFSPRPGKANKYCSLDCYRVAQKRGDYIGSRAESVECETCGDDFVPASHSAQRFCSRDCYLEHHQRKVSWACEGCGTEEMLSPYWAEHRVYCSMECRNEAVRPDPLRCVRCEVLFTPLYWRDDDTYIVKGERKTCSRACRIAWISEDEERNRKIGEAFRGPAHPNWQGGRSTLDRDYRGPNWKEIAEQVRERDDYTCQRCGTTEEELDRALDVHHIEPFHNFRSFRKANRRSNLESLCPPCHREAENEVDTKQLLLGVA